MVEGARRATGTIPYPWRSKIEADSMTNTNPSEGPQKTPNKKRLFLSAEKKFQIYLEAQSPDKPIGELLRREGLFSTDLARIRQHVKEGALQRLGAKTGKKREVVDTDAHEPPFVFFRRMASSTDRSAMARSLSCSSRLMAS